MEKAKKDRKLLEAWKSKATLHFTEGESIHYKTHSIQKKHKGEEKLRNMTHSNFENIEKQGKQTHIFQDSFYFVKT